MWVALRKDPLTSLFFFFNDTATTEIYTLSLHDALPISTAAGEPRPTTTAPARRPGRRRRRRATRSTRSRHTRPRDRKSTRLNSSHSQISYAVCCLKKKKQKYTCLTLHRAIALSR